MLKKVAIGIGIVAALLLLAGVAAALLIDVNRYKPTLERMVADATGRKLDDRWPVVAAAVSAPRGGAAEKHAVRAGWRRCVCVAVVGKRCGRLAALADGANRHRSGQRERLAGSARAPSRRPQQHRRSAAASKGCAQGVERHRIERDQRVDSRHFPERRESVVAFCRRQHDRAVESGSGTRRHRRRRLQAGSDFLIGEVEQAGVGCRPDADRRDAGGCGQQPLRRARSHGVGEGHFRPAADGDQAGHGARSLAAAKRRRREAGARLDIAGHTTARAARHQR